jgi:hypothetical protein
VEGCARLLEDDRGRGSLEEGWPAAADLVEDGRRQLVEDDQGGGLPAVACGGRPAAACGERPAAAPEVLNTRSNGERVARSLTRVGLDGDCMRIAGRADEGGTHFCYMTPYDRWS